METVIEFKISIIEVYQDVIIADLFDIGFSGFEQHVDYLLAFISQDTFTAEIQAQFESILSDFGDYDEILRCKTIHQPQNWNEAFEKSIKPIVVEQFYIYPTWSDEEVPEGLIPIIIDPKMAFGTGYHETTKLMLQALVQFQPSCKTILDVGTGTGILAIAAIKLGAKYAFGFDIDEWSFVNAKENVELNKVVDSVEIAQGGFETAPTSFQFDIVIANINRSVLLELKNSIYNAVKSGGYVFVSGILTTESDWIRNDSVFGSMKLVTDWQLGDWTGLVFKKEV